MDEILWDIVDDLVTGFQETCLQEVSGSVGWDETYAGKDDAVDGAWQITLTTDAGNGETIGGYIIVSDTLLTRVGGNKNKGGLMLTIGRQFGTTAQKILDEEQEKICV